MKPIFKSIFRRLIFSNKNIKTFPAVRIKPNQIVEKVYLNLDAIPINITEKHCIVCHSPFSIAVWLSFDQLIEISNNQHQIIINVVTHQSVHSKIKVSVKQKVENGSNWIAVFNVLDASCFQVNSIRQLLIRAYFKNKNTKLEDKIYGALYSYPRRVIIASFKDYSHYNIFPMDFQCYNEENKVYILGLRTTNITLAKIINSQKIVISDTENASLENIYYLGRLHSSQPPPISTLPFSVKESESFRFPIPDFSSSYKEVNIIGNYQFGTHTMLIGKVFYEKEVKKTKSFIHHIHFLQSYKSNYLDA